MTRAPTSSCSSDERDGLKKGPWTPDEDQKLVAYVQEHGHGSWRSLPLNAGLQRCGKSCRLRWTNYLRPDIKRGRFSLEEDQMIVHLHAILGNRWSAIASHIPRRTDNEIKNYWNTHLKKRLMQMGIDPVTHKSTTAEELDVLDGLQPVVSSNLTHMSQWENARAEAEARLSLQSTSVTSERVLQCIPSTSHQFNVAPKAPPAVDTQSSSFMSSWKAQVAETLRPNFGVVEVEKAPVNLRAFLQEWDSSLQPQLQAFSGYDSPIDIPDLSSGTSSEAVSPCQTPPPSLNCILPSSAQITERLLSSRCCNSSMFSLHSVDSHASSFSFPGEPRTQFLTSTLHGPDHDSAFTNSPCVSSSNTGDSFDLSPQSFSFTELQSSRGSLKMLPQAAPVLPFWSPQQAVMADMFQSVPASYCFPELPQKPSVAALMLNHAAAVPNNIPIPHFDFLC